MLNKDQLEKALDQHQKTKAFVEANDVLKHNNQLYKQELKEIEKQERIDFFPFTHGDLIEN